jgi:dipeptidyl aminopeptidase/acylaminoacyl peptidase
VKARARGTGRAAVAATACAILLLAFFAGGAHAAFPGQAGKIALRSTAGPSFEQLITVYENGGGSTIVAPGYALDPAWSADGGRVAFADGEDGDIWVVDEDGSDLAQLTNAGLNRSPTWSPDGTKIAFERCEAQPSPSGIYVMASDGTGVTHLGPGRHPAWSPNGTKLAFSKGPSGCYQDDFYLGGALWTMNPDGGGAVELLAQPSADASFVDIEWSPDGTRLAFTNWISVDRELNPMGRYREVHVVSSDGTGHARLTPEQGDFGNPAWSPDGFSILIDSPSNLWKMRPDGSLLESLQINGVDPDWQPIPGITGYPRPKGASPDDVFLVPAYEACIDPNRRHGPPLAEDSCAPPSPTSPNLTVGTADSNGRPTKSLGRVRLGVLAGNRSTPADEADVKITVTITDVRRAADLEDYSGELLAERSLRLVDRNNGATTAATMVDTSFSFVVPCEATVDTTIGAHCALETTADALVPGTVVERTRAVWELGALRVFDGGADEDADTTGDNTLFMVQGVFVP